jgi:formylglycine-generating enzyme required for sulfatase activity
LTRSTSVGMYPQGISACGALDMAGNLFEWCQNDKQDHKIIDGFFDNKSKVVRGGSYLGAQNNATCAYRDYGNSPYVMYDNIGLRLVIAPLVRR